MRSRSFQVGILSVTAVFTASASSTTFTKKTTLSTTLRTSISFRPSTTSAAAAAVVGLRGGADDAAEVARYQSLPPTVFAPSGRLRGAERVVRDAFFFPSEKSAGGKGGEDDAAESSCTTFALRCGGGDGEEYAVMVGVEAQSPYLHLTGDGDGDENNDGKTTIAPPRMPLTIEDDDDTCDIDGPSSSAMPMAVLSPTVLIGVGGRGVDSAVLLRRTSEAALSEYRSDHGGTEWFLSHAEILTAAPPAVGGATGVEADVLARTIADMAQSSTQSLGGKYGRMLASSVLVVGKHRQNRISDDDNDFLAIWRVSPTGQFCRSDAAAVGRGAFDVEAEFLNVVKKWRKRQEERTVGVDTSSSSSENVEAEEDDDDAYSLSNSDVREYLDTLTVDEALSVAAESLLEGVLLASLRGTKSGGVVAGVAEERKRNARNLLRKRIRATIMCYDSSRQPPCFVEVVR